MAPDRRPQDRAGDGRELTFETLEHYGEYPDQMPQAIRARDPNGRTAVYVPIKVGGKVVDRRQGGRQSRLLSLAQASCAIDQETPKASRHSQRAA